MTEQEWQAKLYEMAMRHPGSVSDFLYGAEFGYQQGQFESELVLKIIEASEWALKRLSTYECVGFNKSYPVLDLENALTAWYEAKAKENL